MPKLLQVIGVVVPDIVPVRTRGRFLDEDRHNAPGFMNQPQKRVCSVIETRLFRLNCRTDAFLRFVHEPGSVVLAFVKDATVIELIGPGVTPLRDLWV